MNDKPFSAIDFGLKKWTWLVIGISLITICGVWFYSNVLFSDGGMPWGSDTFGHIYRFEYLRHSLETGTGTPDFFPDWYLGIQLFRYYPPLLYYGLAWLSCLIGNPTQTAYWGMFVLAWLGSLSWLFFRRWLGWIPSIIGGILFYLLPDLIRVGFAEGNLLRHLANSMLPLLLFFVLILLEEDSKRRNWFQAGLGLVLAVMVLSHPMMAAISGVVVGVLLLGAFLYKKITFSQLVRALFSAVLGIMISAWWLLPSMSGGITELDPASVIRGLNKTSIVSLFQPETRIDNKEALYVGGSLVVSGLILVLFRKVREKKEFFLVFLSGLLVCLLVTPLLSSLYFSIPFSSLMWPSRFLTFGSFLLLYAVLSGLSVLNQKQLLISGALLFLLALDFRGSLRLIHTKFPPETEIIEASAYLSLTDGWRTATLDSSRMGSAPSYYLSEIGQREQLFGWGFQGATTASLVSGINEALESGQVSYAIDRFNLLGMDDILVAEQVPQPYGLKQELNAESYVLKQTGEYYSLFHRDGSPRAIKADWPAIGIGVVAQNYAYLFPQMIVADSEYLDDYSLDELARYELVVLAGISWHDKAAAEDLVVALSQTGTMVVVDLTKTQENVLSQQPEFLGVWGERVILDQKGKIVTGTAGNYELLPMHNEGKLWYTFTPQNLDHEVLTMGFLGQRLVLTGYNQYEQGKVWFVGLNLAYHVIRNHDDEALRLLDDLFTINQGQISEYESFPLYEYQTSGKEIQFAYCLEENTALLLPFSCYDGTVVKIDGKEQPVESFSNLIGMNAPAGIHYVQISFEPTRIYLFGKILSGFAIVMFIGTNLFWKEQENENG